jgi:formate dehydrogenase subunit gamma
MRSYSPWNEAQARELAAPCVAMEGGLLPALHALQGEFGFIPNPAIALLADLFNLSRADVFGVVTFYHDFRTDEPPGRHVLKLCRAEACQAVGGEAVAASAHQKLGIAWGETSPDKNWTLQQVFCLGLCASGPSALLDDEPVGGLTAEKLASLLDAAER